MSAKGITIIGASAGSGKTYRLTQEITRAVDPEANTRVPVDGLVAVTYTTKAHAELAGRIRHKLVAAGAFTEAVRLPLAYVGTVHAACLRLLKEFALDAGLSPHVDVVAEDQGTLLRQALERALPAEQRAELDDLAQRFKLRWDAKIKRVDWLTPARDIMDLARSNRIAESALPEMAERSVVGMLQLLPQAAPDGAALERALATELAQTEARLAASKDVTGNTNKCRERVRAARALLADGPLPWGEWAGLARLEAGAKSRDLVQPLKECAEAYERHPQFQREWAALTRAIFGAAQAGLASYQQWKRERRIVDYVDMIDMALNLTSHPRVAAELQSRLRFVAVDEFQDTSPIQLALFLRLHQLAQRSVWVGDRKQCIFEYAGADPGLMDAVATWVHEHEGTRDTLPTNHRSRPELVNACSGLFARALARHGFSNDEVVVTAQRTAHEALRALPPFGVWLLDAKSQADAAVATARGIARLLENPAATRIIDRVTKEPRDLRPGDIAVLVCTNMEAKLVAVALHDLGLRVAVARAGLLSTPEGTLLDSALRLLLDKRDTLAAARIDALTGFGSGAGVGPAAHEAWLEATIRGDAPTEPGWRAALEPLRAAMAHLSPVEAVDQVLAALDVVLLAARWPDPAQRLANLDALRALALTYEERCVQEREASTVAGMLRYWDAMRKESLRRDEMLASDDQHVPEDDGAVVVCTYHKSKGLEWPVVVMGSLDRKARRSAFEVAPETEHAAFDPSDPLGGRWIRYWPWPLGQLEKAPLADAAEASDVGMRAALREEKERARLLYVGFTRARDHLILAASCPKDAAKTCWLDTLQDESDEPLITLPAQAADGAVDKIKIGRDAVPARVWRQGAEEAERLPEAQPRRRWFARPVARAEQRAPYRIAPSRVAQDWPDVGAVTLGAAMALPARMPVDGKVAEHSDLGDAVHAFLAADLPGLSPQTRHALAARLLASVNLTGNVRPEALLDASDRFRAVADARWPGAIWHREIPVTAFVPTPQGPRRLSGSIDLLLETTEGYVIIDHKTFPGTTEPAWRKKCSELAPQLAAYAAALRSVPGGKVAGAWFHMPLGGGMLEVLL
jgi:ATP-dependent exoDNAse (exonuclease V) beta subunit